MAIILFIRFKTFKPDNISSLILEGWICDVMGSKEVLQCIVNSLYPLQLKLIVATSIEYSAQHVDEATSFLLSEHQWKSQTFLSIVTVRYTCIQRTHLCWAQTPRLCHFVAQKLHCNKQTVQGLLQAKLRLFKHCSAMLF